MMFPDKPEGVAADVWVSGCVGEVGVVVLTLAAALDFMHPPLDKISAVDKTLLS